MEDLLTAIAQSDENTIEELLSAVRKRYAELFPDWDLSIISLQKSADRNDQIDRMTKLLQELKTSDAEV